MLWRMYEPLSEGRRQWVHRRPSGRLIFTDDRDDATIFDPEGVKAAYASFDEPAGPSSHWLMREDAGSVEVLRDFLLKKFPEDAASADTDTEAGLHNLTVDLLDRLHRWFS